MKSIKFMLIAILISFGMASCSSSDDDNRTKVTYEIHDMDNLITDIKYTKGDGTTADITDYTQFAGGDDSKTIKVNSKPFTAKLEVTANNTSPSVKLYVLVIYVDNVPKSSYNFNVPAATTTTGQTQFLVE